MKPLHEQVPKLKIWNPRKFLIKIHMDLFAIHSKIQPLLVYHPDKPTNLEKLTLVLEDRRFFSHCGIDWKSVFRETIRAISFRKHGGASTIDMQFVRTYTGYRERTLSRKIYEMFLANIIQYRYSKIEILRSYLACTYFGSMRRGVRAAAQIVFSKAPHNLSDDDAAFIAAMLVYPRPRNPKEQWISRVRRRADYGKRVYIANKERFDQLPG